MRGLKRDHTARVIMRGHALMQNIRRGHYELGVDECSPTDRDRIHGTRPNDLNPKRDSILVHRGARGSTMALLRERKADTDRRPRRARSGVQTERSD